MGLEIGNAMVEKQELTKKKIIEKKIIATKVLDRDSSAGECDQVIVTGWLRMTNQP